MDSVDEIVAALDAAEDVVALTGAGVSTASGLPSFRGEDSIWDEFDPNAFHRRRFDADPAGFWADRVELRSFVYPDGPASPNAAHEALAEMEAAGVLDTLLTQNIDGLHQAAGSESVVELHGNHQRVVCDECQDSEDADAVFERAADGELPPTCDCGGVYRPDVVLFGEELDDDRLLTAQRRAREADVFLAVGSSLSVQPAARLPRTAAETGATLAVINLEATAADDVADAVVRADVTEALPRIADRVTP